MEFVHSNYLRMHFLMWVNVNGEVCLSPWYLLNAILFYDSHIVHGTQYVNANLMFTTFELKKCCRNRLFSPA
jgi:hypothetical protein